MKQSLNCRCNTIKQKHNFSLEELLDDIAINAKGIEMKNTAMLV